MIIHRMVLELTNVVHLERDELISVNNHDYSPKASSISKSIRWIIMIIHRMVKVLELTNVVHLERDEYYAVAITYTCVGLISF